MLSIVVCLPVYLSAWILVLHFQRARLFRDTNLTSVFGFFFAWAAAFCVYIWVWFDVSVASVAHGFLFPHQFKWKVCSNIRKNPILTLYVLRITHIHNIHIFSLWRYSQLFSSLLNFFSLPLIQLSLTCIHRFPIVIKETQNEQLILLLCVCKMNTKCYWHYDKSRALAEASHRHVQLVECEFMCVYVVSCLLSTTLICYIIMNWTKGKK